LDGGQVAHAAELGDHVGHTGWTCRQQPTTDSVVGVEHGDLGRFTFGE
jgi:hypothetical protein